MMTPENKGSLSNESFSKMEGEWITTNLNPKGKYTIQNQTTDIKGEEWYKEQVDSLILQTKIWDPKFYQKTNLNIEVSTKEPDPAFVYKCSIRRQKRAIGPAISLQHHKHYKRTLWQNV